MRNLKPYHNLVALLYVTKEKLLLLARYLSTSHTKSSLQLKLQVIQLRKLLRTRTPLCFSTWSLAAPQLLLRSLTQSQKSTKTRRRKMKSEHLN